MPGNPGCSVYIGNLDEKVNDRVLYEVLLQAGQIVDIHIPRDRETNRPKGFAFAEYETEEIADYAVRLFSGVVSLYNRNLKFAISGQDKPNRNLASHIVPPLNALPKPRSLPIQLKHNENSQQGMHLLMPCRFSEYTQSVSTNCPTASAPERERNGYRSDLDSSFSYSRRVFRETLDSI